MAARRDRNPGAGARRRAEDGAKLGNALVEACARLDREAIEAILARGALLEARDSIGRTPLGIAAANGDVDLARTLLDAGADANAHWEGAPAAGLGSPIERRVAAREGPELRTPLSLAVESGEHELVALMIERGARPNTGGVTNPLELAILLSDAAMIHSLLDAGADPNARDSDGDTPLMLAAAAGAQPPIEALLAYGAIASAKNDGGASALDIAARAARVDAFEALNHHFSALDRWRARRALARAARGKQRVGRALRLSGMDRLQEDARYGRLAGVRKALALGVAPDARPSEDDDTALGIAAERGHVSVVRTLLAAGADPTLRSGGETPLQRALSRDAVEPRARPDVIQALVRCGADPNECDADGLTPLMHAVIDGRGAERDVRLLVALGADLSAEHPSGLTALDLAREDPAKADLVLVLESLVEKTQEPPVLGIFGPASLRPAESGDIETLRGLGNPNVSEVVLAVRAPIDAVAPALERLRGGRQWSRKVFDEQGFFPGEEGYLVYQFRAHDWTLVQTDLLDRRALHATDARALSKQLECDAVLIEVCEPSEILRYALYRTGQRVEEFGLLPGGETAFESSLRVIESEARLPALDFVDESLEGWELFVPGLGDDRLEVLAREFEPDDFFRVDFLRIDEG